MSNIRSYSFLKWAGSKRRMIPTLLKMIPDEHKSLNYYEPFLGAGNLAIATNKEGKPFARYILSDINKDLINCWKRVFDSPIEVKLELEQWKVDEETYYKIRERKFKCQIRQACRFIYLNKVGFNGLYRVNKSGKFNVPYGKKTSFKMPDFDGITRLFSEPTIITNIDYTTAIGGCRSGDFIFADPPYHSTFTQYQKGGFDEKEQAKLANLLKKAHTKGAKFILTNSNTEFIRDLYSSFNFVELDSAYRIGGGDPKKIKELVVKNY